MSQANLAFRLKLALELGEQYARNLGPGLIFLGVGPAAELKGYERNTPECRMFMHGALEVIDQLSIVIDEENRIVSVQPKLTRLQMMKVTAMRRAQLDGQKVAHHCEACGETRASVERSAEELGIVDPICCETVLEEQR